MSWHFSRALVEAYSAANCSDGGPSAPLRSTPTQEPSLPSGKTTAASILSRSGTTSGLLMGGRGGDLLTWFLAVSHAKTSALLEPEKDYPASGAGSGPKWRESFARWNRAACTWKTAQLSLFGDLESCSVTWPRWGMMRRGECSALFMQEPPTSESASGLWPTPTVCGNYNRKGASATSGDGPATAVRRWPTPTAQDAKNNGAPSQTERNTKPLNAEVGGPLNPSWVEWLMGWPIGWTDCAQSATDKFRQWQLSHGVCCQEPDSNQPKP